MASRAYVVIQQLLMLLLQLNLSSATIRRELIKEVSGGHRSRSNMLSVLILLFHLTLSHAGYILFPDYFYVIMSSIKGEGSKYTYHCTDIYICPYCAMGAFYRICCCWAYDSCCGCWAYIMHTCTCPYILFLRRSLPPSLKTYAMPAAWCRMPASKCINTRPRAWPNDGMAAMRAL